MIPGLPNPYLALGAVLAFLGAFLGGMGYQHSRDKAEYGAQQAQFQAAAAQMATDAEKRARDADNKAVEAARTAEEQHARDLQTIDAGSTAFAERLRLAKAGAGRNCVPTAATPASQPASVAAGSDGTGGEPDPGSRLREVALSLQADVKGCWAWAAGVGR